MTKPTNILLITTDQQHFSTLGCINDRIKTPHLDRLAAEGTRFDKAYTCNPTCSPTRASIITGLYPAWHGCWTLGTKLPEDVPTVGERFQAAGYATHLIGKAHFQPLRSEPDQPSLECQPTLRDLDFWRDFTGPWYGFERIELARNHGDESHAGQHYAIWMEENGLADWTEHFVKVNPKTGHGAHAGQHGAWTLPEEYHYTKWTGERTIANIEDAVDQGRPFFTWASFHDPHPPYVVSEPWAGMYDPQDMEPGEYVEGEFDDMPAAFRMTRDPDADWSIFKETPHGNHGCQYHAIDREQMKRDMAIYYGMVSFIDQQVGRILDRLDELGLADNTLVIFTTDHGHYLGQHGLRAKGPFHYDDGIRLPFIVRWPGKVAADATSDALVSLVDMAPTMLAAAGLDVPGLMQGVNQLPAWTGETDSVRDIAICEHRHQPTKLHLRTYITDRYKMTFWRGTDDGELFDLRDDPDERNNLWRSPDHADLRAELANRFLHAELEREPMRLPRIAGA